MGERNAEAAWFLTFYTRGIYYALLLSGQLAVVADQGSARANLLYQGWMLVLLMLALQNFLAGEPETNCARRKKRNEPARDVPHAYVSVFFFSNGGTAADCRWPFVNRPDPVLLRRPTTGCGWAKDLWRCCFQLPLAPSTMLYRAFTISSLAALRSTEKWPLSGFLQCHASLSQTRGAKFARDLVRSRGRSLRNAWIDRAMLTAMQGRRWIVFDSDDWGGQRIPSRKVFDQLLSVELVSGESAYDRDTLEHADDLTALAEVLAAATGARRGYGCPFQPTAIPPILISTLSVGLDSRPTTSSLSPPTLARRGDETETMAAWQQAMHAGVIVPQYHGREHLQVQGLARGAWPRPDRVRMGFDLGYLQRSASIGIGGAQGFSRGELLPPPCGRA